MWDKFDSSSGQATTNTACQYPQMGLPAYSTLNLCTDAGSKGDKAMVCSKGKSLEPTAVEVRECEEQQLGYWAIAQKYKKKPKNKNQTFSLKGQLSQFYLSPLN